MVNLPLFNLDIPDDVVSAGSQAVHDYIAANQNVYPSEHIFVSPLFDGVNDFVCFVDITKTEMTDADWEAYY